MQNKLRQTCSAGSKKIDGEVDRLQVELKELVFKIDVESKKNVMAVLLRKS
jgi:hypothetical protein